MTQSNDQLFSVIVIKNSINFSCQKIYYKTSSSFPQSVNFATKVCHKKSPDMDLQVLKVPIRIIKIGGIWITKDSSTVFKVYSAIMQLLFVYIYTFLSGMYIINVTNIIDFADQSCYFFTYFVCVFKCINIYLNADTLEDLFVELKELLVKYEWNDAYIKPVKRAYVFVKIYWYAAWSNVIPGGFLAFFSGRLAYRMWFPYDADVTFYYFLSVVYQWIDTIMYSASNVMMDMLPVLLIGYFISMLQHLGDKLKDVKDVKELTDHIEYQLRIIRLIRKTERIFSVVIFVQGLFSSIVLCTCTIALTTVNFSEHPEMAMKFITFMLTMVSQIFIPCYYGTELRLTYTRLTDSLFHSEWMSKDGVYRKNVMIMLEHSSVPMRIVAFGDINIDLQNFGTICNSAYSLFSVFNRTQ